MLSYPKGQVYWLTGLSGAGKTTIGKLLFENLKHHKPNVVFLDGDQTREVFGHDLGHSLEERRQGAMRNGRLCKLLSDQGIDVVCATISMFHTCREWNRQWIENYIEIYLRVSIDILLQRDPKQLYSQALKGETKNVMGMDIQPEEPDKPDIIIDNDGSQSPREIVDSVLKMVSQLKKELR